MIKATHSQVPGVFATRPTLCGLATILVTLPILTMPPAARAEGPSCSLSRAAATWTFTDSGTVIGVGPRAALGKFTLTGAGGLLNGVATSSFVGVTHEQSGRNFMRSASFLAMVDGVILLLYCSFEIRLHSANLIPILLH